VNAGGGYSRETVMVVTVALLLINMIVIFLKKR
jgi:hypothetical protein